VDLTPLFGLRIACSYTYVFELTYLEQAEGNRTDLTDPWRGDHGLATGTMAGPAGLAQVLATPKKSQNCVHAYILSIQKSVQVRHLFWGVYLGLATFVAFVVPLSCQPISKCTFVVLVVLTENNLRTPRLVPSDVHRYGPG